MPAMRFCMITTFYPPFNFGGDGVFVEQLSRELAQRGHKVEVIHCIDSYQVMAESSDFSAPCDDHSNVTVHRLKSPFGVLSPLATQQTGRPLLKSKRIAEILASDFDVIHFHNVSLVGGPGILHHGRGTKLYTLHEYWLVCPMHVLFKNRTAPCESPSCFTCSVRHRRPPQLWRYTDLMKESLAHIDVCIAPSRF
jgi:glycosyltransferase involved in cell wall biosynthesis